MRALVGMQLTAMKLVKLLCREVKSGTCKAPEALFGPNKRPWVGRQADKHHKPDRRELPCWLDGKMATSSGT